MTLLFGLCLSINIPFSLYSCILSIDLSRFWAFAKNARSSIRAHSKELTNSYLNTGQEVVQARIFLSHS